MATALLSYAGSLAAAEAPQPNQYETPGPVNAQDFLPKSAFSGKKILVEKVAQNDGLQKTYRIRAGESIKRKESWQRILALTSTRETRFSKTSSTGVASATAGGGVAFDVGTLPIGGALGIGLTVIGVQQAVDSLVNESSPYFSFCEGCPSCMFGTVGNGTLTDFTSRRRASWPWRQVLMAWANSVSNGLNGTKVRYRRQKKRLHFYINSRCLRSGNSHFTQLLSPQ